MECFYYNIYGNETNAFLGVIRVPYEPDSDTPPATRARMKAVEILSPVLVEKDATGEFVGGAPGGIRAVMSSEEMFDQYGLNREGGGLDAF